MITEKPHNLLGLTAEEFERFRRACNSTWAAIGGDILDAATGGEKEGKFNSGSIPRSHVIEVVLDCDYLLTYGEGHRRYGTELSDWAEFYKTRLNPWISKHSHTTRFKKLMKEVFPYARYGY